MSDTYFDPKVEKTIDKMKKFENILKLIIFIYGLILLLNVLMTGFWSSVVLLLMFSITLFTTNLMLKNSKDFPNFWFKKSDKISDNILKDMIEKDSKTSLVCLICGDISCERHDSRLSVNVKPFKGLLIESKIDEAMEEILELTLNQFVKSYLEDIAITLEKLDFELRHILRTLISALIRRSMSVDLNQVLLEKLPKVLVHHLETYVWGKRHSRTATYVEEAVLRQYGHLLHPAMNGREDEIKYLTSVVDQILPHLLPPKYMNCKGVDCFFKELMACSVLLPIIDICGDPDKINALLIVLLDESQLSSNESQDKSKNMVEILERFTSSKSNGNNSNNLGITLKQIFSDQQLLFLFQQFSKEEGFINLVQFVLHINSFSQRILNPELSSTQLEDLHNEVINIFNSYFLPNSIDYIKFSEDVFNGFKSVVEGLPKDVEKLRTTEPLYDAYEYINNILETHFCPLFLESDFYFKLICGQRFASFEGMSPQNKTKSIPKGLDSASIGSESISLNNRSIDGLNNGSQDSLDDVFNQFTPENDTTFQLENEDNDWTGITGLDRKTLKDMSAWRVSVPKVETRIDSTNGRDYDVFIIDVQRLDVQPDEEIEMTWSVERRYNEFYVLESKLKEFHGQNLNEICLPPKRSFVKLNKSFMESRRPEMEKFLKQLLSSSHLKGSQLVFAFLRSPEEFTTGFLPDIRFGKMIRTVPAKFAKERGQHLEPFLLSFISSTEQIKPKPSKNEMSELLEYSPHEFAMANLHKPLYQNMGQWNDSNVNPIDSKTDTERTYAELEYVYDYLLFFLIRFYNIKEWILNILFSFRPLLRKTLQSLTEWYVRRKLKRSLFVSQRMVELIHLLRDSLYFENDLSLRTSQLKKIRSQTALKFAKQFIPKWIVTNVLDKEKHEEVMYLLFSLFQYPLLNKQLIYLIFDIIVKQLFPEILLTNNTISDDF